MIRLFVGIPLPDDIVQHLHGLAAGLEGAHWISRPNMHLTLRFIGQVDEVQAADINDALSRVHGTAFEASLAGLDAFGRGHMVHTIWAAVNGGAPLSQLQGKVEWAMVQADLEPERRKFTPHVTLARVRKSPKGSAAAWLADHASLIKLPFNVDEFVLFQSHLGRHGAHYEQLAQYPLISERLLEAQLS